MSVDEHHATVTAVAGDSTMHAEINGELATYFHKTANKSLTMTTVLGDWKMSTKLPNTLLLYTII